jgi:quinol monooxygenase YgiN
MTAQAERRLYAEFVALPGSERRVADLVEALTPAVRAEVGCLQFDPFTRVDNPRHWVVMENYTDEDAFQAHLGSEHSKAFNLGVADHIAGGASSLVWLAVPKFSAVDTSE